MENPKIDVRIIVSNPEIAEVTSKAINNINLEEDYNIIVSSIIPTDNLDMAKKVAVGGDIILIGGYGNDETFNLLYNDLKTDFNHLVLFDYNNIFSNNDKIDISLAENEIFNSIIKAGLSYSLNIINIHSLENKLEKASTHYNELLDEYNKLLEENNLLSEDNKSLKNNVDELNNNLDNLKSDFSSFKARYNDIYNKNILEIYDLEDLWFEIFNEQLIFEDKIVIATNKFKPEDILVGQGYIGAKSKELAIDWLKIIKTALIFLENNENELKAELDRENIPEVDYSKDKSDDDYDIPNNFENFWG